MFHLEVSTKAGENSKTSLGVPDWSKAIEVTNQVNSSGFVVPENGWVWTGHDFNGNTISHFAYEAMSSSLELTRGNLMGGVRYFRGIVPVEKGDTITMSQEGARWCYFCPSK